MPHPPHDLFAGYADLREDELLVLARSYPDLTAQAQQAMRDEFSRRGLDAPLADPADPEALPSSLVTVHRYRDLSEAIVARSFLEASGIPVFLCDENLVRLDWQISNFIGGIRLQVEARDQADARDLLAQPVATSIAYQTGEAFIQPRCPVCDSTNVAFQGSSRSAALASLYLLALPLPLGPESWLCNACATRWEDAPEP